MKLKLNDTTYLAALVILSVVAILGVTTLKNIFAYRPKNQPILRPVIIPTTTPTVTNTELRYKINKL